MRSKNQQLIHNYLLRTGSCITSYELICDETRLPYGTVRDILRKMERAGLIRKAKFVDGRRQGLAITISDQLHAQPANTSAFTPTQQPLQQSGQHTIQQSSQQPLRQSNPTDWTDTQNRLSQPTVVSPSMIDRVNNISIYQEPARLSGPSVNPDTRPVQTPVESNTHSQQTNPTVTNDCRNRLLALSDDDIDFHWPALAKIGFRHDQIRQIIERLEKVGKSPEHVLTSLDYCQWDMEKNRLRDKDGNPIDNPCGYFFNALARSGYYRRPTDFVSADELAARDAETTARATLEARKQAEDARFDLWRNSLSEEERKNIRKNRMGPEDVVLKLAWKELLTQGKA